jgi:hypothetical protein
MMDGVYGLAERWGHGHTLCTALITYYTHQLVTCGYISGIPNVLYKDVMGAQNHLRLEILRAARGWSEDDHRNAMGTIDRPEALRREQAGTYRDAMRYGGQTRLEGRQRKRRCGLAVCSMRVR